MENTKLYAIEVMDMGPYSIKIVAETIIAKYTDEELKESRDAFHKKLGNYNLPYTIGKA